MINIINDCRLKQYKIYFKFGNHNESNPVAEGLLILLMAVMALNHLCHLLRASRDFIQFVSKL